MEVMEGKELIRDDHSTAHCQRLLEGYVAIPAVTREQILVQNPSAGVLQTPSSRALKRRMKATVKSKSYRLLLYWSKGLTGCGLSPPALRPGSKLTASTQLWLTTEAKAAT